MLHINIIRFECDCVTGENIDIYSYIIRGRWYVESDRSQDNMDQHYVTNITRIFERSYNKSKEIHN